MVTPLGLWSPRVPQRPSLLISLLFISAFPVGLFGLDCFNYFVLIVFFVLFAPFCYYPLLFSLSCVFKFVLAHVFNPFSIGSVV